MGDLGQRLKKARTKKNLTGEQLANKLGIARTTYTGYETGHREPDISALEKIANILEVSLDYLISGSEHSMDEKMKEIMSDPYAMAMFSDFSSASEEDKKMWLEIWNSIKNRGKDKE